MDELISTYIDLNYTLELGYELQRSLQIFDYFEYKDPFPNIIDFIMTSGDMDKAEASDQIVRIIKDGIDYIYKAHGLVIKDDCNLDKKNELILALGIYMKLEDYTTALLVLDSDREDMEMFVDIMVDICMLTEIEIYDMIEEFDPQILSIMKEYAEGKTPEEFEADLGRKASTCVQSVKSFSELYSEEAIGVQMLKAGTLPGASFESYLAYVRNDLIDNRSMEISAKNILSVLLLSVDGNNTPIITYKKYIDTITDSIEIIQKLEPLVLKLFTELENYRRAKHDQK